MKKTFLLLIFCVTITVSFSQNTKNGFFKGNAFVGGSLGFSSEKDGETKKTTIDFSPKIGFFITNNLAIGMDLGYGQNKTITTSIVGENKTILTVGAFGKYYFNPSNQFSLFGNLGFDYNSTNDLIAKYKTNGFDIGLSPGVSYFLSNNFVLEASIGKIGFVSTKPDVKEAVSKSTFDFNLNISTITFGLSYKF